MDDWYQFRYTGNVPTKGVELTTEDLEWALLVNGGRKIRTEDKRTSFQVGFFSMRKFSMFNNGLVVRPATCGGDLVFSLNFARHALFAALVSYGWLAGFGLSSEPIYARIGYGTLMFAWFYLGGYFYAGKVVSSVLRELVQSKSTT